MYRMQFLQAFDLKDWNETEIKKETLALYEKCNKTKGFTELIDKLKQSEDLQLLISIMGPDDDLVVFQCLFKFELFDLAHKYFCNVIENKPLHDSLSELVKLIK